MSYDPDNPWGKVTPVRVYWFSTKPDFILGVTVYRDGKKVFRDLTPGVPMEHAEAAADEMYNSMQQETDQ